MNSHTRIVDTSIDTYNNYNYNNNSNNNFKLLNDTMN